MSWIILSILSAFFLGIYDLLKKSAVRDNAVLPVLFISVAVGAVAWLPAAIWSAVAPGSVPLELFKVETLNLRENLLVLAKSALVGGSWLFSYFAVKHLPLSISAPIRATAPLWTISIAVLAMGERPDGWQWAGIAVILASFYAFSLVGRLEGIHFHRDKWVGFMIVATVLGALSALYDKHLIQSAGFTPSTLQCWFSIYLVIVLAPFQILWWRGAWTRGDFEWRWSIPLIGISLLIADFLYFTAIRQDGALISVISPVRRTAVLVTFTGGVLLYGERNFRRKALCIAGILAGVVLLNIGR